MSFLDFIFGKKEKKPKPQIVEKFEPSQSALMKQIEGEFGKMLPMGMDYLRNILGGDEEYFDKFQAPSRRDFEQKTLPSISERLTGVLGESAGRSSALPQLMTQAGKEFEEDMSSERLGMQQNAFSNLMSLLAPATAQRQYQYTPPGRARQPGLLENLGVGGANALGQLGAMKLMKFLL